MIPDSYNIMVCVKAGNYCEKNSVWIEYELSTNSYITLWKIVHQQNNHHIPFSAYDKKIHPFYAGCPVSRIWGSIIWAKFS